MTTSVPGQPAVEAKAFSRTASGLIRVAGGWDVFIFNVGLVSIGIAVIFLQYFGLSSYPGASIPLGTLAAVVGMVFVAMTFYFWSTIFPRSGGVYVALSRTTSPLLAFVFSLMETMVILYLRGAGRGSRRHQWAVSSVRDHRRHHAQLDVRQLGRLAVEVHWNLRRRGSPSPSCRSSDSRRYASLLPGAEGAVRRGLCRNARRDRDHALHEQIRVQVAPREHCPSSLQCRYRVRAEDRFHHPSSRFLADGEGERLGASSFAGRRAVDRTRRRGAQGTP